MDEASIAKTASSTKKGHYEFLRMLMGLKTTLFTFQRAMNAALYSVHQACQAYLDDLLVHARTFEDCLQALECMLQLLQKHGLQAHMQYLGYLLTREGVKIDPAKVSAIQELLPPRDVRSLQQVLGPLQYYTRFHPQYAEVATPLTNLTKKGMAWDWMDKCQAAFDHVKHVLTFELVFMWPDFSKPFVVQTDWSSLCKRRPIPLVAPVAQEYWDEERQLTWEVVVCYASKKLRGLSCTTRQQKESARRLYGR